MKNRKIATSVVVLLVGLIAFGSYKLFNVWKKNNFTQPISQVENVKGSKIVEIKGIEKVTAEKSLEEYAPEEGGDVNSVVDGLTPSWWYGQINADGPAIIELHLKNPEEIAEVDVHFLDRYATDIVVNFKYEDSWVKAKEVSGNAERSVPLSIDPTKRIKTKEIQLIFAQTIASDNLVSVAEVNLFKQID